MDEQKDMVGVTERDIKLSRYKDWVMKNLLPKWQAIAPDNLDQLQGSVTDICDVVVAIEENLEVTEGLVNRIMCLVPGIQVVTEIVEMVSGVLTMSSATKFAVANATMESIYDLIDKGSQGDKDRVKFPWVTQGFSDKMERWVLQAIFRFGIEVSVLRFK